MMWSTDHAAQDLMNGSHVSATYHHALWRGKCVLSTISYGQNDVAVFEIIKVAKLPNYHWV